jgi:hypothetical protein
MTLLPTQVRHEIQAVFGGDLIFTDLEFARLNLDELQDVRHRKLDAFIKLKSQILNATSRNRFRLASVLTSPEPISTSMDDLFGGPLRRGEVTSVEGASGVGKTRVLLKIAHDVAATGRALYIDSDLGLPPAVLAAVQSSMGLTGTVTFLPLNSILDLYATVNAAGAADLIVIDSVASLFQSSTARDGPGSAMLQEFALELKQFARDRNCAIVVANNLRPDRSPFLGRLYASLWHQRLLMSSRDFMVATCELIQSPRSAYRATRLVIESLTPCADEELIPMEPLE